MAAYFVALVKVKDPAKMQEYAAAAGPTLAASGGTPVARGKVKLKLVGDIDAESCLIVKFATADAAKAWYDSPAYQALIPLRDAAISSTFFVLEEAG